MLLVYAKINLALRLFSVDKYTLILMREQINEANLAAHRRADGRCYRQPTIDQ